MTPQEIDRIECAIRHIQTAADVDPWACDIAVEAMKRMIAEEWIPCKERLPEVGRSVLFSRRSMCTREGCLQADGNWWQYWWYELLNADQVTAWKPMPEPYRAERRTDGRD